MPALLIDRRGPGEMTSYGNAGGIQNLATTPIGMPGMLRDVPRWLMDPLGPLHIQPRYLPRALPWLLRFARETTERRARHNAKALNALNRNSVADTVALARWAGVEHLIELSGQLYLFRSRADYENDRLGKELRDATGQPYEVIGNNAIRDLEPDLAPIYEVALHVPGDGFCRDPHKLTTSFAEAAIREGAEFLRAEVTGFERSNGTVCAVKTDRGRRGVSAVLVAAGAWSKPLARLLGHEVPLESQRGYHVTISNPGLTARHICLLQDRKLAITPMAMGLRIAGTVEFGGAGRTTQQQARRGAAAPYSGSHSGDQHRRIFRMDGSSPGVTRQPAGDRPLTGRAQRVLRLRPWVLWLDRRRHDRANRC